MSEIKKALEKAFRHQAVLRVEVSNPLLKSVSLRLNVPAVRYVITRVGKEKTLDYLLSTAIEEVRDSLRKSIEEDVEQMLSGLPTSGNTLAYRHRLWIKGQ